MLKRTLLDGQRARARHPREQYLPSFFTNVDVSLRCGRLEFDSPARRRVPSRTSAEFSKQQVRRGTREVDALVRTKRFRGNYLFGALFAPAKDATTLFRENGHRDRKIHASTYTHARDAIAVAIRERSFRDLSRTTLSSSSSNVK